MKHRGLVKTADQEKSALKREMEALHAQLLSTRNKVTLTSISQIKLFKHLSAGRSHDLAFSLTLWVFVSFVISLLTLNDVSYSRNMFGMNKITIVGLLP